MNLYRIVWPNGGASPIVRDQAQLSGREIPGGQAQVCRATGWKPVTTTQWPKIKRRGPDPELDAWLAARGCL